METSIPCGPGVILQAPRLDRIIDDIIELERINKEKAEQEQSEEEPPE